MIPKKGLCLFNSYKCSQATTEWLNKQVDPWFHYNNRAVTVVLIRLCEADDMVDTMVVMLDLC